MPELIFKGKEFVYNHHLSVPFRPLEPHADKGVGPVNLDGNLIIHGDNLHALKSLLPMYAGKVDCIFIDPPYNTGNEKWSYNDNVNSPVIREWLNSNPVTIEDSLRHDKWCAMMYPRLRLLHELLHDDGSIWMTIDDNEGQNARSILDEIFGAVNFVATVIWQKKYSTKADTRFLSQEHDYLLIYAKNIERLELCGLERTEEQDANYKNPDNDPRGDWASDNLLRTEVRDYAIFEIVAPDGKLHLPPQGSSWRFNYDKIEQLIADNRIWFGEGGTNAPRLKRFLSEVRDNIPAQTIWKYSDVGHSDSAKKELQSIMTGSGVTFPTPKPVRLVERVIKLAMNNNATILDSFAGSGTTAQAVLAANMKDGGNRKFILVECEDYADTLTAERVRRVINGYTFHGTHREALLREKITFTRLRKADKLLKKVDDIENLESHRFDRIKKEVKEGELLVTGEKDIEERVEGLGGSFTYCSLGAPLELDRILTGERLPSFESLAGVLFHTATNEAFTASKLDIREGFGYLGESTFYHLWLIYKPDLDYLKSREAALTFTKAEAFASEKPGKRHLVFAPARFVSQKMLDDAKIPVEFAPLPFALYRIERS